MMRELGEIMIEREFESLDGEGKAGTIQLRVGKPFFDAEASTSLKWRCYFQITGIGSDRVKEGASVDSTDAMLVCLQLAEAHLKIYGEHYKVKITWLGDVYLGLYDVPEVEAGDEIEIDTSMFQKAFDDFFANYKPQDKSSR